jgi:hypothetical protein
MPGSGARLRRWPGPPGPVSVIGSGNGPALRPRPRRSLPDGASPRAGTQRPCTEHEYLAWLAAIVRSQKAPMPAGAMTAAGFVNLSGSVVVLALVHNAEHSGNGSVSAAISANLHRSDPACGSSSVSWRVIAMEMQPPKRLPDVLRRHVTGGRLKEALGLRPRTWWPDLRW